MMITIHGFPAKTKYQDVKILIKQECNINDFILDNLINDTDGTKKVRIGLTDNTEGYKVMKFLDGYRMPGNFVLKAVPVGKAASSLPPQQTFESRPTYQNQPRNDYSNAPRNDYMSQPSNDYNNQGSRGPDAPHSHGGIHGSSGVHGSGGIHGSVGSHGPRPSQGGPHSHGVPPVPGGPQGSIDSMNRPSPWVSGGGNGNQWNAPMAAQVPQNTFGFTSPQTNVNPSYGQQPQQHQGHPRAGFNQGRATDQGYGYTPKSNVPEAVPANSRYRWVRKEAPEPKVPKSPHTDDDCPSPSSADDETLDETSQDVPNDLEKQGPSEPNNQLGSSETTLSKKARKREEAKLRNIKNLTGAQRRRLFFWVKQGKSFMEARQLCETRLNRISEYPAAKAEKKKKAREVAIRRMSPERQARAIKVDRLKGRGIPGDQAPIRPHLTWPPIRVRIVDEVGYMSQERIEQLQDKILELVDAETDGNGPSFVGCSSRSGCLILTCANDQTLEWLENQLPNFQIWEGAHVKIINLNELPKPVIGVAYVPDPNLDEDAIIRMLKSQNEGFDFSDWWVTSRKPDLPNGQTVTFTIDKFSVEKLAERNNFVYLGLKKIKIRLRTKNVKAPPGQGMLPMRQKGKGKMDMPPMGQKGKGPKGKIGMPPKRQRAPMDQMGMSPMGPMGMGPIGPMGTGPIGPMGIGPMIPMGMAPMDQIGMGPMGPMGMGPMGQMGMGPMGPMGKGPMGPMGMGPMGQMCMGPMGPMGKGPMGPMGMDSMGQMGPMGPMGTGPLGPMGMRPMRPMGFVPAASTSTTMHGHRRGSSYAPGFSQPNHFGGGNQPKNFSGGKNHKKNKKQGRPASNYGGPNPNSNKKPNPNKAKSKGRKFQNPGNTDQGKKPRKKPKGRPSFN